MGIYVKGMKMPKTCFECDLYNDKSNFCKALKEYMPFTLFGRDYKKTSCPLVEASDSHGDLIDEDELITHLSKYQIQEAPVYSDMFEAISNCIDIVKSKNIVIEAEGERWKN